MSVIPSELHSRGVGGSVPFPLVKSIYQCHPIFMQKGEGEEMRWSRVGDRAIVHTGQPRWQQWPGWLGTATEPTLET